MKMLTAYLEASYKSEEKYDALVSILTQNSRPAGVVAGHRRTSHDFSTPLSFQIQQRFSLRDIQNAHEPNPASLSAHP
jgi:hypothetical protein